MKINAFAATVLVVFTLWVMIMAQLYIPPVEPRLLCEYELKTDTWYYVWVRGDGGRYEILSITEANPH